MRVALISYEYPPDTAYGGIATYTRQAAQMLADAEGVEVEVFCGSPDRSGTDSDNGCIMHRVQVKRSNDFARAVMPVFVQRHQLAPFDLVESPEYNHDSLYVAQAVPDLAIVLKLHTPSYVLNRVNAGKLKVKDQVRGWIGALRRGRTPDWVYSASQDPEAIAAGLADRFAAPTPAIGDRLQRDWRLNQSQIDAVPYPYKPAQELLNIPIGKEHKRFCFVGRLEPRKGISLIQEVLPDVLSKMPDWRFRFVGPGVTATAGSDTLTEMRAKFESLEFSDRVEFTGGVDQAGVFQSIAESDVCVFPSRWESFGLVVLEALSAGRAVIGSQNGGMASLLAGGTYGMLIDPCKAESLKDALITLASERAKRDDFGTRGRAWVLENYSPQRITQLQLASYRQAIQDRKAKGPRNLSNVPDAYRP